MFGMNSPDTALVTVLTVYGIYCRMEEVLRAQVAEMIPENRIDLFCACIMAGLGAFAIAKWVL
jgi:hypothetical protein